MDDWLDRYWKYLDVADCPAMGPGCRRWCEHMADILEGKRWTPRRAATAVARWLNAGAACGLRWEGQPAPRVRFAPPPLCVSKRHHEFRSKFMDLREDLDARCLYWIDYVARDFPDIGVLMAMGMMRWVNLLHQCGGSF